MDRVSIRDVARLAGVSPTAVSFVINGKKGVSEATREKVLRIIRETGFVPDNNSRRFFFGKHFTVALVGTPLASPFDEGFYYEVAKGLDLESGSRGYSVILTSVRDDENILRIPEVVRNRDTDGLVFLLDIPKPVREAVHRSGLPCVVADAENPGEEFTSVRVDYREAARTATRYLIEKGHRAIAFLCGESAPHFYQSTREGYLRAMGESGLPVPQSYICGEENGDRRIGTCMRTLLGLPVPPTAIFCAADMLAVGAMNCARDMGVRVPEDLSFIGIDDVLLSAYVQPPLTTVRVDKIELGRRTMDLLLRKIAGEEPPTLTLAAGPVMQRGSVRNLI